MSDHKPAAKWEDAVQWLRSQPDQQELVRFCFFDDPLEAAARRYEESSEWREIRNKYLPQGKGRALDLGAGRGIASYALAVSGWQVTALEPDPSDIVGAGAIRELASASHLPIEVCQEYGEKLPFPDRSFDLVFGRQVLHHAHDLGTFCSEMARVLVPGGILICIREHVISRKTDLARFQAEHPLHRLYGGEHAFLLKEYLKALRSAGFNIRHVLNPFSSNINLYPTTKTELRQRLAKRLRILPTTWIGDFALALLGWTVGTPGRLFSFIGEKE